MNDPYSKLVFQEIPRLISLQDRRPFSPTFGCFDKNYWHFRTSDFANAAAQMGCEALARSYQFEHRENPYYQADRIADWAKAGAIFLCQIQRKDGSFDEWYPNERGWAGPTGYVLHSLVETYVSLKELWTESEREIIFATIESAAKHLSKRDEGHILANHFAVSIMALQDAYKVLSYDWIAASRDRWWNEFQAHVSPEGWSLEYDGVDFGYNLGTLSFLGRVYSQTKDPSIVEYAQSSFAFLQYLCFPDGSFAGRLGSRSTSHFYPFALEYWRPYILEAAAMADFYIGQDSNNIPAPGLQDDHYLMYRLSEYLEAAKLIQEPQRTEPVRDQHTLPIFQSDSFQKSFPDAGLLIRKSKNYYFATNLKRGAVFALYDLKTMRLKVMDAGIIGKPSHRESNTLTSQHSSDRWCMQVEDNACITQGPLEQVRQKYFSPIRLIIFRTIMILLGFNAKLCFWAKIFIRKTLIVGERPVNSSKYKRRFTFTEDTLTVYDQIDGIEGDFICGTDFSVRYVPQSNYYHSYELENLPIFMEKKLNGSELTRQWEF